MILLDTTYLLDYLEGTDAASSYLEANEENPLFAASLSLFELYRGAGRVSDAEGIEGVAGALDWVEPVAVDESAAREAAEIEAELHADGAPINLADVLVAGTCRVNGATLVTRDEGFDRIEGLTVDRY